ncbi:ankyrin repeat-containing domain protein [Baffinella frigidus]|nr:ankyrin repeat-containing domain protein [Cryptophyta sp. CCMP2293]
MDGWETWVRGAVLSTVSDADRTKVEQLLDLLVLRSDKYNSSPLHLAVLMRRLEACQALLAAGADPNLGSDRKSPLHLASEMGQDDAAQMLLEAGADTDRLDRSLRTPLVRACEAGHGTVARKLLAAGANATAREPNIGSTCLQIAADKGHVRVVEALLEHGALHNLSLHTATDRYNQSPLWVAAGNGRTEVVDALLHGGADANQEAERGSTPLHSAALGGHAAAVKP